MMSLFSSFDLNYFLFFELVLLFFVFRFVNRVWFLRSNRKVSRALLSYLRNFFLSLNPNFTPKGLPIFMCSVFLFILLNNFLSIFPFVFAGTSQIRTVLGMVLTFWLAMFFFRIKNNFKSFVAHCVPEGSPRFLVPLLFLIELVRNFIRPVTLTVRLVANILAGHLLIILLRNLVLSNWPAFLFFLILTLVEIFVSAIQSYIFCTILVLYVNDVK